MIRDADTKASSGKTDGKKAESGEGKVKEPELFTFKSKYREDKITLRKPQKIPLPGGAGVQVIAADFADFDRNNWSTTDPELAAILREKIRARELTNPLGVFETTGL